MRGPCKLRQCFQIFRYFDLLGVGFNLVAFHVIISCTRWLEGPGGGGHQIQTAYSYISRVVFSFLFSPFICQAYNFPSQARQKGLFRSDSFAVGAVVQSWKEGPRGALRLGWASDTEALLWLYSRTWSGSVPSSLLSGQGSVSFCCLPPGFREGGLL